MWCEKEEDDRMSNEQEVLTGGNNPGLLALMCC